MKKIKYLLIILVLAFSFGMLAGCNNTPSNEPVEITKEYLESLVFEGATYDYTGDRYSLEIKNLPEGVTATYYGNDQNSPGEHTVMVYLKYGSITVQKTAVLTIIAPETIITAEEHQTRYIYANKYNPEYSLSNSEQSVSFKYYKDGVEVSANALTTPGTYTVDIIAEKSALYSKTVKTVTVTTINSKYNLSFLDKTVEYNGSEHVLELEGTENLPAGYTVSYSDNKGTETGAYYAKAMVKDASGNVVETHAAVLDVVNPENEAFNDYLDMFFVEFLEEDQLSVNIYCENAENFGLSHYEAEWYSYESSTPEEIEEYKAYLDELLTELEAFKDERLSVLQQVAYNKVSDFLYENIELYEIKDIQYLNLQYVDQFGGYVADFSTYMEAYTMYSRQEVEDIVSFIVSTETAFASYLDYVEDRSEAGYALSDNTIKEMRTYLADVLKSRNNYYLGNVLAAKIDTLEFLNESDKASYKEQISTALKDKFMVGVETLYNGLESYLGKLAKEDEGYIAKYEDGKKVYINSLDSLLGINDFDIEAYIKEVEASFNKASADYMKILMSIANEHDFTTVSQVEDFVANSIIYDGTPEEMMTFLKEFAPTIVPDLESDPDIKIKNMDLASQKVSNAVAYYVKSALDNTGTEDITLNPSKLGDANDVLGTLAHEGYPGHLYAYVRSKEIGQHYLSTIMTSTAHAEGWATYVQMKLYEYAKANSSDEGFKRAMDYLIANEKLAFLLETRVDVGILYEGWTVSQVASFLSSNGYNGDAAQGIYDLLIEMPSQYAAYGYGKIFFVKIHDEAKKILGAYYDEVEFNGMIHSRGWTNLGELENTYNEYMIAKCHKCGIDYNPQ